MRLAGLQYRLWIVLVMLTGASHAETVRHASGDRWWGVIVGVGHYEHLQGFDLDGPPRDVPLIVKWLRRQSVPRAHLTVLADHVAGADALPTRSAIFDALTRVAEHAHRGDVAFLYLAGHGSQQPQGGLTWSKADGMEEIFLPRDVGPWDGSTGTVERSISGPDLGGFIEGLRAKGVFVWLVVDSCHSATMARMARIPHLKLRAVPPKVLQEPAAFDDLVPPGTKLVQIKHKDRASGYAAFYAAQSTEAAPEMPLPAGEPGNAVHGLFTYALLKALGTTTDGSYRDVAHRILAFYAGIYPGATPEFEGALDGPLGSPEAPFLSPGTWPARRDGEAFRIEAGRLNQLAPGSLLALYPSMDSRTPWALLQVDRASLTDSWATVLHASSALKNWKIPADRGDELASGTIKVLRSTYDLTVRVSEPTICLPGPNSPLRCTTEPAPAEESALFKARELARDRLPSGTIQTAQIDSAEVLLLVQDRRLYVLRGSAAPLKGAAYVDLDSADAADAFADLMRRAVRVVALLRLSAEFPEIEPQLDATLGVRSHNGPWRTNRLERVGFGDELSLRLQNIASVDIDVTVFSVTDDWAISPVYPVDQESNLLRQSTAALSIGGWARRRGDVALVFIIEENHAGRSHDLGYLAQPGTDRAVAGEGLGALLEQAGFLHPGERGGLTSNERRASSMRVLHYYVSDESE